MRRALAQQSTRAASSLHPSMLAAPSIIYTLQCTHGFQTHYQSRDYFLKPDAPATATKHQNPPLVYADTNTSAPRSALLQSHQVYLRRSNLSIRLSTSNHAAQRWRSFSALTISVSAAPLSYLHLLLLQLLMDAAQMRTCRRNKNYPIPSPQPYLTTNTVFTLLHNLLSTFPGSPCVLIIWLL